MLLARLWGRHMPVYRQKLMDPIPGDYVNMLKLLVARYALSGNHRVLRGFFNVTQRLTRRRRKEVVNRETVPSR